MKMIKINEKLFPLAWDGDLFKKVCGLVDRCLNENIGFMTPEPTRIESVLYYDWFPTMVQLNEGELMFVLQQPEVGRIIGVRPKYIGVKISDYMASANIEWFTYHDSENMFPDELSELVPYFHESPQAALDDEDSWLPTQWDCAMSECNSFFLNEFTEIAREISRRFEYDGVDATEWTFAPIMRAYGKGVNDSEVVFSICTNDSSRYHIGVVSFYQNAEYATTGFFVVFRNTVCFVGSTTEALKLQLDYINEDNIREAVEGIAETSWIMNI